MAADVLVHLAGVPVLACAPDGPPLCGAADAANVVAEVAGEHVEVVLLPVERLAPEFFTLRSGVAAAVVQKFVNYHLRVAVVGDIAGQVARSSSLRDFVEESNRGRHLWFVATPADLADRLRHDH
ncbi:DUF4180 domain-containing protein [Micromonospora cathayae]|uniref:DUF4180 domain-containing protein n=1 Tax=Micromonospora cathayae TaxID=3028804 RepID=A0ABY7ZYB0_9ACTN|nr:DUF4180 domain-containing protein [Micromonospora sp. HUAS 3]WDZ87386.1 DUF4180 domain-containing protein [Micromonospora sp. HUAS 3]